MVDVAALIIFLVTYAIIAIQKIPRVHISRAAGALIGAVAMGLFGVLSVLFRGSLRGALPETPDLPEYHELSVQCGLLMVSLANLALFLGLLIVGVSPQWAAISCAALILVLASNRPRRALQYVDWTLLLLFAGLFIVMRGLEATSWLDRVIERAGPLLGAPGLGGLLALIALTVLVSNLVSNVPAVLLLAPILARVGAGAESWLSVAMAATLAGNLTIIGSAANLIVLELASQRGVHISFWTYLKVGLPVTLVTIAISTAWLTVRP
jgi:Na+/H+ antiporter NhaD/arsenite permease-like protein